MQNARNVRSKEIVGVQLTTHDGSLSWTWEVNAVRYTWRENGDLTLHLATGPEGGVVAKGLPIAVAVGWTLGYEAQFVQKAKSSIDVVPEKPAKPAKNQ